MAKKNVVPRGCTIHGIRLNGKKRTAEIRYRCGDDWGQKEYRKYNRKGEVTTISNYPSKVLRGIRSVRVDGFTVTGDANVNGFSSCARVSGGELNCKSAS